MGQCDSTHIQNKLYIKANLTKKVLYLDKIKNDCKCIGSGFHCKAYLYPQKDIVLKIMNKPYLSSIIKQMSILDSLSSIWPDLCEFQIINKQKIVGLSVKYFDGRKIDQVLQDKQNIYHKCPQSRVGLVEKLRQLVNKIQLLNICHADINLDNVLIKQPDKNQEQCQVMIIDFGNGFIFNEKKRTKKCLNGWAFMVPPEARSGVKYDPKGANAYMLGRVALQILLLTPLQDYSKNKINPDPRYQLQQLRRKGFNQNIIHQIQAYLSNDLDVRNNMLGSISKME